MNYQQRLTPAPHVADQFGITRRTLSRWLADDTMGFPKATIINGRLYFEQLSIDTWKFQRARRSSVKEAA